MTGPQRGRWVPAAVAAAFLVPIVAGAGGTLLGSLGVMPALAGRPAGLAAWRELLADPALPAAVRLSLTTGFASTLLALGVAVGFCAAWHGHPLAGRLRRVLPPLLAVPHAAFAVGFAFLLAPSGWVARALSPWATGWPRPPDLTLIQDPWGIALTLALACKEAPFLVLALTAALGQVPAGPRLGAARALGYGPVTAWLKVVLPPVYRQIRLPVLAVLAYSLSAVEPALVLAPTAPPPLTPLLLGWYAEADLAAQHRAAAAAVLHMALVLLAMGVWRCAETVVGRGVRPWLSGGRRGGGGAAARTAAALSMGTVVAVSLAGLAVLAVWAVARVWRFPDAVPSVWGTAIAAATLGGLERPALTTLGIGAAAVLAALAVAVACLEVEKRTGVRSLWLAVVYVPLLLPPVAFLFGVQVLLSAARLDGSVAAVVWAHGLYVLPYVFLTLADPWRAFDERYARSARSLGLSPAAVLWRVRLPMLLRPLLVAAGVGFAVSAGQYLPTLVIGGGRVATLTIEAVAVAGGGDPRVSAVTALAQAALPLVGFAVVLALPGLLYRNRKGMRAG